jgi:hypothetical protein
MRRRYGYLFIGILALFLVFGLVGCDEDAEETTTTTAAPQETTTTAPPMTEPEVVVPFLAAWEESGHNDAAAEAFVHWDEDDPAVVPASCARCHSTPGYIDYVGADGTAANAVDAESHPIGSTVECEACHNAVTLTMDSVLMPSGIELTGLGREARCMQCHQGRHSTVSVNAAIEEAGVGDDTASEDLGFANIHYFAAAATKYGTEAKGGYEYEGKTYDAFFVHVEGYSACQNCHDPHTLELKIEECAVCHEGVASVEDLQDIRMPSSLVDYDGDGDLEEGVYYELIGMQEILYAAIQNYAADAGVGIVYDSGAYPYFFADTNGDGVTDADEANFGNRYASWTPRLLRAAYNYQVSLKDPGTFAHGGKYIFQLMYDAIEDLGGDVSNLHRIDHGHFAGSEEAFRHWDEDPAVPGRCARCHSADGLPTYLAEGVNIATEQSNGFLCTTCHTAVPEFTIPEVAEVEFPSGATVSLEDDLTSPQMQLCISCHQGRESGASVDQLIGDKPADTVDDGLRFLNIHYFAAGATIFGTDVNGGYEYAGKTYNGRFEHVSGIQTCTDCHDTHALEVRYESCGACHPSVETSDDLDTIRITAGDFDGDGDEAEGLAGEIETMEEALLVAMQDYAAETDGVNGITYNAAAYPYFFDDAGERYGTWTPRLLQAAYNYQYVAKDPGGFAHNGAYVLQLLYDSIQSIGGDVSGMTRP